MLFTKVVETTTTTGTGTMTMGGASGTGNRSFGTAAGTGNRVFYYRETSDGATWELGWGVVTVGPPDTITRNLIASSSGSLINWAAGTHYIFSTPPQEILATELLENALASATRPSWMQAGGNWADKSSNPWKFYIYDGANDVPIGTFDTTAHAWNPIAYSADAGATEAPNSDLYRKSASPAAADVVGSLTWSGDSSTAVKRVLAKLLGRYDTATNAAENATIEAHAIIAGTLTKIFEWGKRVFFFKAIETAKGASVASATSCDIWTPGDGNLLHITGTTTITSFATAPQAGAWRHIIFDGVLTLTHGAAAIVLPGAANITTAAGDEAWVLADTTTKHLVHYQKADGTAVTPPASIPIAATQAEMEAVSSTSVYASPGRAHFHPGVAKAWAKTTLSAGTPTIQRSYNITSVTDNGVGKFTYNFTTSFSDANYSIGGTARSGAGSPGNVVSPDGNTSPATGSCAIEIADMAGVATDRDHNVQFWGDI